MIPRFLNLVVCCILASSSSFSFAEMPPGCEDIEPSQVTGDDEDDHLERNNAKLVRSSCNQTSIGIKWSVEAEDLMDLCGYSLHWYGDNSQAQDVKIKRDITSYLVTDLNPGSKYQFHIVTYYATQHKPRSWLLVTFTTGCGPDVNFCNLKGTERCDLATGQCICKTNFTSGDLCDICPHGFYLHDHGCVSCDNCVTDGIMSNGTCRPAADPQDTMMCDCIYPYTGKHCRECEKGFHWKQQRECSPCECYHDKAEENRSSICDQFTGKCECSASRTGDRCERCAEGYAGNALAEGCFHVSHAGLTALIIIVVIIIVLVAFIAFYLICHRRCKNHVSQGFWKVHLREEYDKVNFTTLEEDPDCDGDKAKV